MRSKAVRSVYCLSAAAVGLAALLGLSACAPATSSTSVPAQQKSSVASGASSGGSSASTSKVADIDACKLVNAAAASTDMGVAYTSATSSTIASGQDQCAYGTADDSQALVVIVYQPGSGVTWDTLKSVQQNVGTVTSVPGLGDQAMLGAIELDVQAGKRFIAIQGGDVPANLDRAKTLATAEIAALG